MSQDQQVPPSPGSHRPSAGFSASPSALLGWALALAALVAGYLGYGWPGVALAVTVIVFWLLLQFSRALRTLRQASGRPVGQVDNAVMLHARLRQGQTLADVLRLTRSLGQPVQDNGALADTTRTSVHSVHAVQEVFAWQDAGGDTVRVELHNGRVKRWQLLRAGGDALG